MGHAMSRNWAQLIPKLEPLALWTDLTNIGTPAQPTVTARRGIMSFLERLVGPKAVVPANAPINRRAGVALETLLTIR